jgi:hypothetical protein
MEIFAIKKTYNEKGDLIRIQYPYDIYYTYEYDEYSWIKQITRNEDRIELYYDESGYKISERYYDLKTGDYKFCKRWIRDDSNNIISCSDRSKELTKT